MGPCGQAWPQAPSFPNTQPGTCPRTANHWPRRERLDELSCGTWTRWARVHPGNPAFRGTQSEAWPSKTHRQGQGQRGKNQEWNVWQRERRAWGRLWPPQRSGAQYEEKLQTQLECLYVWLVPRTVPEPNSHSVPVSSRNLTVNWLPKRQTASHTVRSLVRGKG